MKFHHDWMDAGAEPEFELSGRKVLRLDDGREILVLRVEGGYYAVHNVCSHAYAEMGGADLDGYELACPLHGAKFDIRTGRNLTPPAVRPLNTFATRVQDGRVLVRV